MTLLTICQNVAPLLGIPEPQSVAGNLDLQVTQLRALVNTEGRVLARRHQWEALVQEASFQTVAAIEQGAMATIAPGFQSLINDTMWDRDFQNLIAGPLNAQTWQAYRSTLAAGPYYDFRIRGGQLLFYPEPTAGDDVFFEYRTENWCESEGGTGKPTMTVDTDVGRLDEWLIELGVRWRFLEQKGLDYAEPFRTYEKEVNNAMAKDGGSRKLNLASGSLNDWLGHPRAPDGSWGLPGA